jgi:hypothetical protein
MRVISSTPGLVTKSLAFFAAFSFAVTPVFAQRPEATKVSIFGDGDPHNGIEDSRQRVMGGRQQGLGLDDQRMNAGTIKCDGKIRGTAMVVDTREFAPGLEGVVLASAAHVLYDLQRKRRFRRCEFHLLALSELPRFRVKIDFDQLVMGNFDPDQATGMVEFGEGDWVFLYIARPWRDYNPDESLLAGEFSTSNLEQFQQAGGEFRLIAFDSDAGVISMSRHCTVIESSVGDLGGGAWPGQLLDDCDSSGGSSGGGIIAILNGQQYLVGIRSGSHWSEQAFPSDKFPLGPPDGALWNRNTNTNFGRAFDADIIHQLKRFSRAIETRKSLF